MIDCIPDHFFQLEPIRIDADYSPDLIQKRIFVYEVTVTKDVMAAEVLSKMMREAFLGDVQEDHRTGALMRLVPA
ncbi:hypothetical protein [Metabacillus sp. 84]|uniref:hypothetical protein n=1 Tax=unclassified Metabacillus TaxID=2675274 RepID=UPI003CEE35DD